MKILINGNTITESVNNFFKKNSNIQEIEENRIAILNELASALDEGDNVSTSKLLNALDKAIGHLKRNKKTYIKLVFLVAMLFDAGTLSTYALASDSAIDIAGRKILGKLRSIGYWVFMAVGAKDIILSCLQGRRDNLGPVIILNSIGFGALYFLPTIFDIIKDVFA